MNKIIAISLEEIPVDYTGIVYHSDGAILYFLNGQLHREDGPAVYRENCKCDYWIYGKKVSQIQSL